MAEPYPEPTYYETYSEDEERANNGPNGSESSSDEEDDFLPSRSERGSEPAAKKRRLSLDENPPTTSNPAPSSQQYPPNAPDLQIPAPRSDALTLEPSIINAEPLDEFIREIADWILRTASGRNHVEVEAKIGVLLDARTRQRLSLPVMSETILAPDYPDIIFESNVALAQHAHFNALLNSLVANTSSSSYPNARVHYAHTKLVDSFHSGGRGSEKIRVTTDERTGQVKECVVKTRIANLNIFSPKRKVDWRISVNTEMPAQKPTSPFTHSRRKDRITYTHQAFQVDLTQVTPSGPSPQAPPHPSSLLHELELEFRDSKELMRLAALRERDLPGGEGYDELVRVFVNNVHILVRNAR